MKKALKINISGSIQTSIFKRVLKETADKLNLKGFVRTLDNGSTEVFAQGEQLDIEKLIDFCRGTTPSVTRRIEQKEERLQDFKDFKVLTI